jgi:hypothetical protein
MSWWKKNGDGIIVGMVLLLCISFPATLIYVVSRPISKKAATSWAQEHLQRQGYVNISFNDIKTFDCPRDKDDDTQSIGFIASYYDGRKFIGNECISTAFFGVKAFTTIKESK